MSGGAQILRALLRKQIAELGTFLFVNRKTGKGRTKRQRILFLILYAFLFLWVGVSMFWISISLCVPLVGAGMEWLYFAIMGMIALALGVVGSAFNAYAGLYNAKDNDLLLSMPIPPRTILLARVAGISLTGTLFEALVMIPAIIARAVTGGFGAAGWIFSILTFFVLSLLITTLTCLLGWLIALIAARLKNKSFLTVLIALVFLAGYYFVYFRAMRNLSSILESASGLGDTVKTWIYPMFAFGQGCAGSALHFLLFAGIVAVLFALEYWILTRTFLRIVTTKRGEARAVYKERAGRASGADAALLRREFMHFTANATYMLNCGLGSVMLLAAAVALLLKGGTVREAMEAAGGQLPFVTAALPVLTAAAVGLLASMNDMTAPSVSLEGKSIWIVQSMPVRPWQVLRAKLCMQVLLTGIPALLLSAAAAFVLRMSLPEAALAAAAVQLLVALMAAFGLAVNLKLPNLTWTNEIIPIKQGMSVLITLFGGMLFAPLCAVGYLPLAGVLSCDVYLAILCAVLAAAVWGLIAWLKRGGARIFASLS